MATTFDPLSQQDISNVNTDDIGIFQQPQTNYTPGIGQPPAIQATQQALDANRVASTVNRLQQSEIPIQAQAEASKTANQLQVAALQNQQFENDARIKGMQVSNAMIPYFGSFGPNYDGTLPIPPVANVLNSPLATQQIYSEASKFNTALQIARLQGADTQSGLQARQQLMPLQQQIATTQLGGQQTGLAASNAAILNQRAAIQAYQPRFDQVPLNPYASPSELAQTQLQRATMAKGLIPDAVGFLGINDKLENGQPLHPDDLLNNPNYGVLRQRDPQQAENLFQGLFGQSGQGYIARLQQQHEAQVANSAHVADTMLGEGKIRRTPEGLLQRDIGMPGAPQWATAGTDQFPQEQANLLEQGIQTGRTGLPIPNTQQQTYSKLLMEQIAQGKSLDDAKKTVNATIQNGAQAYTANQVGATRVFDPQTRRFIRPLTSNQKNFSGRLDSLAGAIPPNIGSRFLDAAMGRDVSAP